MPLLPEDMYYESPNVMDVLCDADLMNKYPTMRQIITVGNLLPDHMGPDLEPLIKEPLRTKSESDAD